MLTKSAIGQPVSASAPSVARGDAPPRSARHAPGTPAARRPSERTSHAIPDSASARPRASGRPKATRAGFAGANGGEGDAHALSSRRPRRAEGQDGDRHRERRRHEDERARAPGEPGQAEGQQQLRAGEDLEEGGAGPERAGEDEPAAALAAARAARATSAARAAAMAGAIELA